MGEYPLLWENEQNSPNHVSSGKVFVMPLDGKMAYPCFHIRKIWLPPATQSMPVIA